jgi:hypothetical protein
LIDGDILASNVSWDSEHVSASIEETLISSEKGKPGKHTAKDEAVVFLCDLLAGRAMPVTEVEREARDAGLLGAESPISQNKAFRSARETLKISPKREGGMGTAGRWVWELPAKAPSQSNDALVSAGAS